MPVDLRDPIKQSLQQFQGQSCAVAANKLLATLGYSSERTIRLPDSKPQTFLDFVKSASGGTSFNENKALFDQWVSADLLFQLTDDELSGHTRLFKETNVNAGLLRSYLFFALELRGGDYPRGKLNDVARQINRIFPMPVMVFLKNQTDDKKPVLSIAVINRRQNKRDTNKDVLGKVTIIRNVSLVDPHRGHLEILNSLALKNLDHPERVPIDNFDLLHETWERIFNVELLNKQFYQELANWYFWALDQVEFPDDIEKDREKRNATSLIRLLTRLIFCWFLKEKDQLIPEKLFSKADLEKILVDLSDETSTYYQAILQNLFFGTLNQRMGKDKKGKPHREFVLDEGYLKNRTNQGEDTHYRYEGHFSDPAHAVELFADVPFLNGGLFECLDRLIAAKDPSEKNKKLYLDGFSRTEKKRAVVPNRLFFAEKQKVDLSEAYGEAKHKKDDVRGLLPILHGYKFTIVENTPIDQEIALDPELLGKVFENLLASYNEETKTTARKQTGSFYTPRAIVDYMVDEALMAHLTGVLVKAGTEESVAKAKIEQLFAYTEEAHRFEEDDVVRLLEAIHACKILDPACGSGAFPMGVLQKLVHVIRKLDPGNVRWKQLQIDGAQKSIPDPSARDAAIEAIEDDFANNGPEYGRKLYLIEKCLYGVDIQPIAIQISKLRFFISLISEQTINRKRDNLGIRPLPNLETKFVAADALMWLTIGSNLEFANPKVEKLEEDLARVRHAHFTVATRGEKLKLQLRDKKIRDELSQELKQGSFADQTTSTKLANWDPYDPQLVADFLEPQWMFGSDVANGFDIVIGNPPYGAKLTDKSKTFVKDKNNYKHQDYQLDSYLLFIERGIGLLREGGIQCYIVPNTWLPSLMLKSIRRFICERTTIASITDVKTSVFTAIVDTTILIHRRSTPVANVFPIRKYSEGLFELDYEQDQEVWRKGGGASISLALTPALASIAAAFVNLEPLEQYFVVTQGSKLYQVGKGTPPQTREIVDEKPFTSDVAKRGFRALLRGKHVTPFNIIWNDDLWVKYGPWLAEPRESAGFDDPEKVLIRQTGDTLIAARDDQQFVAMDNLYTIRPRSSKYNLFVLVALLNSSALRWYYRTKINPESGEPLAQVKKGHLIQLPMPQMTRTHHDVIASLVPLIEFAKRVDMGTPARFLENLIDACVMECYFREHMAERKLLFLDELAPHLDKYDAKASESKQREFVEELYRTLNAPKAKIRNQLLRIAADSPDLLAVILKEGTV